MVCVVDTLEKVLVEDLRLYWLFERLWLVFGIILLGLFSLVGFRSTGSIVVHVLLRFCGRFCKVAYAEYVFVLNFFAFRGSAVERDFGRVDLIVPTLSR